MLESYRTERIIIDWGYNGSILRTGRVAARASRPNWLFKSTASRLDPVARLPRHTSRKVVTTCQVSKTATGTIGASSEFS